MEMALRVRRKTRSGKRSSASSAAITRTVTVPSVRLSKKKYEIFRELERLYRAMVEGLVDYAFDNKTKSPTGLIKRKYRELRGRYPQLPSLYVVTACRDASTRVKSFLKLKKMGLATSERPAVKKVCVWLHAKLWKQLGHTAIRISTHKGWIHVELTPHKHYWMYVNNGWRIKEPRVEIDHKRRMLFIHLVFEKEAAVVDATAAREVISVDVNEDNVTVKVRDSVFILKTDIKRLTIGYEKYREAIQSIKGNRAAMRAIHGRERKRKKDVRYKIANLIANTAARLGAVVAVENLPKKCPENMIKDVRDSRLRHRIYQAGFRSVIKAIEGKCMERGVPVVKINPKDTSSLCPSCGSRLVGGDAPRAVRCDKCQYEAGRDVVAVLNIERRALQGLVTPGPMPDEPALKAAVLPVKEWARRKSPIGDTACRIYAC